MLSFSYVSITNAIKTTQESKRHQMDNENICKNYALQFCKQHESYYFCKF